MRETFSCDLSLVALLSASAMEDHTAAAAFVGGIPQGLVVVQRCLTQLQNLHGLVERLSVLFPEELLICQISMALTSAGIPWTGLPWARILDFLDATQVLRLTRLTSNGGRWTTLHARRVQLLPFVLTLHSRVQLAVQRLVGHCTGEYHFEPDARTRRYVLQNQRLGKSRVYAVLSNKRWHILSLCTKCRRKEASSVCTECTKAGVLVSNSATRRFPPFNLDWKACALVGSGALEAHTVEAKHDAPLLHQTTDVVNTVHLSNAPRHFSTLTGNYIKCAGVHHNGLPVFQHACRGRLVVRALATPGGVGATTAAYAAVLFRDERGHWVVKVGPAPPAFDLLRFIRSKTARAVFRSTRCGGFLPCSVTDAVPLSSWVWEEQLSFRATSSAALPAAGESTTALEQWILCPALRVLRGGVHYSERVVVLSDAIQGSEFEGTFIADPHACVPRSARFLWRTCSCCCQIATTTTYSARARVHGSPCLFSLPTVHLNAPGLVVSRSISKRRHSSVRPL